jgi:DNA-binding response OmpR family regulator
VEPPLYVLVVEDHAPLRSEIVTLLQGAGHTTDEAADGRMALVQLADRTPDVVLLDLALPGMGGLDVCRQLRETATKHIPVLMLTARDTLADKLMGFDAGADDYLVKPFAAAELLARITALSRRAIIGRDFLEKKGELAIDRRSRQVTRGGQEIMLAPIAFRILTMLFDASPRAVSKSELVDAIWQGEWPDSDPLRTHVFQLRQALDRPFATPMVQTVHGVGFRLVVAEDGEVRTQ